MRFVRLALRGLAALGAVVSLHAPASGQTIVNQPLGLERPAKPDGGWVDDLPTSEEYLPGVTIFGTDEYRRDTRRALDRLAKTAEGRAILAEFAALGASGHGVTIRTNGSDTGYSARPDSASDSEPREVRRAASGAIEIVTPGPGTATTVFYDPSEERRYDDGDLCRPNYVGLGHELIHAIHNGRGENLRDYPYSAADGDATNHEEARTIGLGPYADGLTENDLREELGYEPRDNHATACPAPEDHPGPEGGDDEPDNPSLPWPRPKPERPAKPGKPGKPGEPGGKTGGATGSGILDALDAAGSRAK